MSKSRFLTESDEIYSMERARSLVEYGDIKLDDDLSHQTVKQLLKKILQPYKVASNINLSITDQNNRSVGGIYEKSKLIDNKITSLNVSFNYKYWSNLINSYTVNIEGYNSYTYNDKGEEKNNYIISHNKKIEPVTIQNNGNYNNNNSIKISVSGNDGVTNNISIGSKTVSYIRPYFLFVIDTGNDSNFNFDESLSDIQTNLLSESFYKNNSSSWIVSDKTSSNRIVNTLANRSSITFTDNFSNKGQTSKIMMIGIPENQVPNGKLILINSTLNDVEFDPVIFKDNTTTITGANGVSYKLFKSLETKFDTITYTIKSMS